MQPQTAPQKSSIWNLWVKAWSLGFIYWNWTLANWENGEAITLFGCPENAFLFVLAFYPVGGTCKLWEASCIQALFRRGTACSTVAPGRGGKGEFLHSFTVVMVTNVCWTTLLECQWILARFHINISSIYGDRFCYHGDIEDYLICFKLSAWHVSRPSNAAQKHLVLYVYGSSVVIAVVKVDFQAFV